MLLILVACDSQPVRVPVSQIGERGKFHQVRHGDTLYSIAWRYGQDYHDIAKLNGISKPYTIYVGQRVWLSRQQSGSQSTGKSRAVSKARTSKRNQGLVYKSKPKAAPTKTFVASKFDWQWPVRGKIISRFGNQKNRKLKTITENVGIEIQSAVGTPVITVLDGVISTITYIRGHGNIIIVDHGGGFNTVYAQVENIQVNENEYIQAGDRLAKIASDGKAKNGKLHFEVWGNQQKLNPEHWLSKK